MSYAFTLSILVFGKCRDGQISPSRQAKKYLNSYLEFLSLPEENKANGQTEN